MEVNQFVFITLADITATADDLFGDGLDDISSDDDEEAPKQAEDGEGERMVS